MITYVETSTLIKLLIDDAVHLAAAHMVGADVFSSADRRLCEAARTSAFTSPILSMRRHRRSKQCRRFEIEGGPTPPATKDSGVHGIPVPARSERGHDAGDGYRRDAIVQARADGHSWAAIGAMVGTSGDAHPRREA